jgi:pimeloyl-ACP methyl ester carboxylesterase
MGAKTVMAMALRNPDCCANIIPVDNAPVDAALSSDFPKYAEGMQHVERSQPKSQREADKIMEPYAKDLPVRQFLLTNLMRPEPGAPLKFRIPVNILTKSLDHMADFPFTNPEETQFSKRALFIRGTKSHYVSDETLPIIGRFFPRFELVDIDAGHWVISEKPEEFIKGMPRTHAITCSTLIYSSCCGIPSRERVRMYIRRIESNPNRRDIHGCARSDDTHVTPTPIID